MQITYNKDADAMYIYLSKKAVAKTVRASNHVMVELDAEENLRGVEIRFASQRFADADFSHIHMQLPKVGEIDLRLPIPAQ